MGAVPTIPLGQLIADRFEIGTIAGSGGMGTVYRARDRASGAEVALKVLHGADESRAERFNREARVLAELSHPGLVKYIAHGITPAGERYLAMEWLDGIELSDKLAEGRLSVADSLGLVARVAQALSVAHGAGVIHRDIKPSNLFLPGGQVERVKVLDFGVARWHKRVGAETRTGHRVGTPRYMAPEQVRGSKDVDARVDVFALGCVLFACLTGRQAFTGDDEMAVLAKILLEESPRLSDLRPDAAPGLDELVARMLSKDPRGRPRDGAALVTEIEALAQAGEGDDSGAGQQARAAEAQSALTGGEQRLLGVVVVAGGARRRVDDSSEETTRSASGVRGPAPEVAVSTPPVPSVSEPSEPARVGGFSPGAGERVALEVTAPSMSAEKGFQRLYGVVWRHGGHAEQLADGSLIATIAGGGGTATDQAIRAARCALGMRELCPDAPMALATGRGVVGGASAVGEVIDRAMQLIRIELGAPPPTAGPRPIRVGEIMAGLLDTRFEIGGDDAGLQLLGERETVEAARTLLGKPTPCVGRDLELATLEGVYAECVAEPVARAVLVTARPGVGKSRLRYELLRRLRDRDEPPEVWIARADPLHAGAPFGLLSPVLRRAAGILDGEPAEAQRQKLRGRVGRHVRGEALDRVAQFLGELCHVPFPDGESVQLRAARGDPMLMGDQMRRAWEDLLAAETTAGPLLIILEDLHWGDLPSVRFVESALRHLADRPLMVLALARPEVADTFPRLWEGRKLTRLELPELSKKASEKLVKQVLGDAATPERIAALVDRAAGNAFFLEELIRAAAVDPGNAELPGTVLAMVHARLEELPPEARRVLRAASVFGQVFWEGGVAKLLGGEQRAEEVADWLAELVNRELVSRRVDRKFPREKEFVFRHALLREGAYNMLTDKDRALGHKLAGEWLDAAGESSFLSLAEHFERGGERRRAVGWFLHAAEQALEGNDLTAAIERAGRGIACGAEGEELGRLHLLLSEAESWRGQIAPAERNGLLALDELPRASALWFVAAGEVAAHAGRLGHYERVEAVARELLVLGAQRDPARYDRSLVISAGRTAIALLFAGRYELGEQLLDMNELKCGVLAERDPGVAASLHRGRAIRALAEGDQAAGLIHWPAAIAAHEQAGDLRAACQARGNLCNRFKELGGYAQAEKLLHEVREAADRLGLPTVATLGKHNLGLIRAVHGKLDEARALELEAASDFMAQGDRRLEAASRAYLSSILIRIGELDAAENEAQTGVALSRTTPPVHAQSLAALANARRMRGDSGAALTAAREAMRIVESLGGRLDEGESQVRLAHAEALHAAGLVEDARAAIGRARDRLLAVAAKIQDPVWRASFLENVPDSARTMQLAAEWG